MILVSENIRYMLILVGVHRGGGVKYNTCYCMPASKLRRDVSSLWLAINYVL